MADSTPFLTLSNIAAGYGGKQVLKGVSFEARAGELTGLLGANGCGKTTLLKALCRQIPSAGTCLCGGVDLSALSGRELARRISYIPQRTGVGISLPALEVILMGFNPRLGLLESPSAAQRARAREALAAVGLADAAYQDYQTLSEGQKQLCVLARAMVEDASLLLLDEPESSLDFPHRRRMMKLLTGMVSGRAPGGDGTCPEKAGLVALHDPALALEFCRRLVLMKDGVCAAVLRPTEDGIPDMEAALSEIYGPVRLADLGENGRRRLAMLAKE